MGKKMVFTGGGQGNLEARGGRRSPKLAGYSFLALVLLFADAEWFHIVTRTLGSGVARPLSLLLIVLFVLGIVIGMKRK